VVHFDKVRASIGVSVIGAAGLNVSFLVLVTISPLTLRLLAAGDRWQTKTPPMPLAGIGGVPLPSIASEGDVGRATRRRPLSGAA
jgi:hypothetical protein